MLSKTTINELKGSQLNEELNKRNYIYAKIGLNTDFFNYVYEGGPNYAYLYVFFNPVTKKSATIFNFSRRASGNNDSSYFKVYFPPKIIIVANETKYTIDIPYMLNRVPTYNCVYARYTDTGFKVHKIIEDKIDGKLNRRGEDMFPARLARVSSNYKKSFGSYLEVEFNVPGIDRLNLNPKNPNDGAKSISGSVVYQDVIK